ncbi:MAG: glycosyltransferase [Candidatus Hydrogenedentes bacterium]|nr:glycosyltransferase [Candidatus Hydrogenedentota bacterium]
MISIIIPAFNQLGYTRQCIASILENTEGEYRLILVDNGSTEAVYEFFCAVPGAVPIRSETNLGFAAGVNLGLRVAEGHVLLLNNDTLVPRGWLTGLCAALESAPDIGVVGPMSNYVSGSQLIPELRFESLDDINAYAEERRAQHGGRLRDVARLVGFCMLIRDRVVAEVGLMDEAFGLGNFEDDDYCVRVLRAGYRLCVDEASFVFHYGNRTFHALGLVEGRWDALLEENAARFGAKWNLKPEDRLDEYREALQLNRKAGEALAQGDLVGAIRGYRDALLLAPQLARSHNDLAVALWQAGAGEDAFERLKAALRLDPEFSEARENLLDVGRALGREEEARDVLGSTKAEDDP